MKLENKGVRVGLTKNDRLSEGEGDKSLQLKATKKGIVAQVDDGAKGQEVLELGGLYVLGTERHESRRIDRQLRGRSGRQGDPGASLFFLSLEDDLMRLFMHERVAKVMDRLELSAEDRVQVRKWVEVPPRAEEVDPNLVPPEHRQLFLDTVRETVLADHEFTDGERENLDLFEKLLQT